MGRALSRKDENLSTWLAIPSKRPTEEAEKCLREWRERGYKIALLVDWNPPGAPLYSRASRGDLMLCGGGQYAPQFDPKTHNPVDPDGQDYPPHFNGYPGYARSVNALIKEILRKDEQAEWFVCAGDDTLPDPNHSAEEIAIQCSSYFSQQNQTAFPSRIGQTDAYLEPWEAPTFGVMQPTGHRWGEGQVGFTNAPIDRVAGSPWIGREFARRMYGGAGPYWHEYRHQFVDEELQNVAIKMGVFWQRPDLIHFHNHWALPREGERMAPSERMPAFLAEANSPEHWKKYKAIFEARKAAKFPGHEPIA